VLSPDTWTQSSFCANGSCLAVMWVTSSHSGGNGCIEARHCGEVVQVRDTKTVESPILQFAPDAWSAFIDAVRAGKIAP